MNDDSDEEEAADEIRLWEEGWKERYYRAKFHVEDNDHELRKNVVCAYIEGLSWVLLYYYQVILIFWRNIQLCLYNHGCCLNFKRF